MLNCTDLACVLHHHHFYAHLHHLKHHLQDDHDHHHDGHDTAGDGSDVDSDNIQDLLNETDTDLSSLSHLDAPNDVLYMIFGVVIAMLLVGLIIVLVAVTISKLRKREESSVNSPVRDNVEAPQVVPTTATVPVPAYCNNNTSNSNEPVAYRQNPSSVWVFPPLPPQPNLYSYNANSIDALVHPDKGFKGLKRQLSGRFKRLVSRKPHVPTPVIPPELKPQLKTIYVY